MKIYEVLDRDPRSSPLANEGQARITGDRDGRAMDELRAELVTFVCDGQFGDAMERILQSYLAQLDRPRQNAAWVSGFFGSGKSHLLKMLGHLWVDTAFADGSTARSLVTNLPDDVRALLRELDTRATRLGKPALAAAGAMPSGSNDQVRQTVLSIVLRACGLPDQYSQAQFCFWLREQGHLAAVRGAVEAAGKDWLRELNNLYASPLIARSVLMCDPAFAKDEREARQVLRDRFPKLGRDLTTAEFLQAFRDAAAPDGNFPLTILVLDEVQQFIGQSTDRSVVVTELAEAIQTQLDSRVMLVASGQSALTATEMLQKLRDRFRVAVQLSDTDVEAVTRKVLLRKKLSAEPAIKDVLDRHAGEVARQLQGTRLAERTEDRKTIVPDYPLLPTRRRFFEECFRRIDSGGSHGQLRSQLRILHEALRLVADEELGRVIPADVLYVSIARDMVNTGVLLNELETRIRALDDGTEEGRLRQRACGIVFLIGKLPREAGVDSGVRATAKAVSDLLVDDLVSDSGPFRSRIEKLLDKLADEGRLMKVGDEYRLQTPEGAEWEAAFRVKVGALVQQEGDLSRLRDQLLAGSVQAAVNEVRIAHGESKVKRTLVLHARNEPPPAGAGDVVVWLRDGFNTSRKEVESEARRRGQEDPVVHVFIPRKSAEELRAQIAEVEAASFVIDSKGVPTADAGREAREGMQSRLTAAQAKRDEILRDLVTSAQVYLGGGAEVFPETLRQKLDSAAQAALARLFPRFGEADHRGWEAAFKRARDGADRPFQPVSWDRATEEHPVAKAVVEVVAAGSRGTEVRKALEAPPFGWPRESIDAALVALCRSGTLRALANNQPITPDELDHSRIQSAEFRVEKVRLGTQEKIALRAMLSSAAIAVRSGEEEAKAPLFLARLIELARDAGGDAPLPACPSTTKVADLQRVSGSDLLAILLKSKDELEGCFRDWTARKQRAEQRLPGWNRLQRLLREAKDLDGAADVRREADAIVSERSLLADTDHVAPLTARLAQALRAALTEQAGASKQAHAVGLAMLAADNAWKALGGTDRTQVCSSVGLIEPMAPALKTDDDLLVELERQSLSERGAHAAAVPERVARALAEAARRQSPTARRVALRTATLANAGEVRTWLTEHEKLLLDAVATGPVIVG